MCQFLTAFYTNRFLVESLEVGEGFLLPKRRQRKTISPGSASEHKTNKNIYAHTPDAGHWNEDVFMICTKNLPAFEA